MSKVYVYQIFMVFGRELDHQTDTDFGLFSGLGQVKEFIRNHIKHTSFEGIPQLTVDDYDVYRHKLNMMNSDQEVAPVKVKVNM